MHHFVAIDEFKLELKSGNANLVQNQQYNFFSHVSLKSDRWPWNLKNNKALLLSNIMLWASFQRHMWIQTESYGPESAKLGFDLCDLGLFLLTLTLCRDITSVIGNKFHDDTMMETYWKKCDIWTDGWTDWTIHRAAWLQLKIDSVITARHLRHPIPLHNLCVNFWRKIDSVIMVLHLLGDSS